MPSLRLGALNWEESAAALSKLPVLIPVGGAQIEHGPHLPYSTDARIAQAIAERVAERIDVLLAPPIDTVYAPEIAGRGATVSLRPESFVALVSDVIRCLARHGAQHVVLIDRGSGTAAPLQIVSREMHEEIGITVAIANPVGLAYDIRSELLDGRPDGHAGEEETSLMLVLAPKQVHLDRLPDTEDSANGSLREPVVLEPAQLDDEPGFAGNPRLATPEKGERILTAIVHEIVAHIDEWRSGHQDGDSLLPDPPQDRTRHNPPKMAGIDARTTTATDWPVVLEQCPVAVLPLGAASKEHGHHLPNETDFLTAEALRDALLERFPVFALPTFGYGYYPAFIDWPGSITLRPETYRMAVEDIVRCLTDAGFEKILLLDTGLSTRPVLEIVAREMRRETGARIALATTELGREAEHRLFDGEGTHANEDETALMLAIAPEQVRLERAVRDMRPSTVIQRRDPFAPPAFIQGGKMRSESGVFGDPTKADPDRGRAYLQAKIDDLSAFMERFLEG